jgi:hypothetical protein
VSIYSYLIQAKYEQETLRANTKNDTKKDQHSYPIIIQKGLETGITLPIPDKPLLIEKE